jgi:hypothetical protein
VLETNLQKLLLEKKSDVLKKWLNLLFESYPAEASSFLKKEKDPFANPAAYEFQQGLGGIYEALLGEMDSDSLSAFLDQIVRIRAIQELSPSRAIAFIFLLKNVLRETLGEGIRQNGMFEDLSELESRIDGLALLSFDVYMNRREKIYQMRIDEVKRRVGALLRRTGLTCELEEEEGRKEERH